MVRWFIIFALVFAAPLQSFAGKGFAVDGIVASSATLAQDQLVTAQPHDAVLAEEAGSGHCCREYEPDETKSTICTPDCKAVIAFSEVKPGTPVREDPRLLSGVTGSNESPVDLRPPIS